MNEAEKNGNRKIEFKKGIFILPSLFTCGNMAFGILSVMSSINGQFIRAAWILTLALLCDILDGRIARMTHTTSDFGLQLDSLSDLVSFGIAPAMMIYMLVLKDMGKIGAAIAVLFVLSSALRLARFNVMALKGVSVGNFMGLPTPASAGVLISFVLSYELLGPAELGLSFKSIPILMRTMPAFFKAMPVIMVVLSFLMVSNVPYYSFKHMQLTRTRTIRLLVVFIVLIILIVVFPQNIFFIIFVIYALSGFVMLASRIIRKRRRRKTAVNDENREGA
jgi:CDP-diacylglycerol--serine O-phosphatidyltransferase